MKRIIALILLVGASLQAQEQALTSAAYTSYGQMIYWKSLTTAEKKVFLHAFLYRTYEIGMQLNDSKQLKKVARQFQSEIVEPVLTIFANSTENQKDDLIFWIDKFYRNDLNKEKPFYAALLYAWEKLQTGQKSLYDTVKEQLE